MNYIDVNVLVYWLTDHPDFGEAATKIVQGIQRGEKACTSSLTLWLLHVLLKRETENYSEKVLFQTIFKLKDLKIVPLTFEDYVHAVAYKEEFGIDLEDSLHYTAAKRRSADVIYSNDTDFDKTDIERRFE